MASSNSTMQPITIHLHEKKALAAIYCMSNRILRDWVGRGTCWLVVSEILSVLIAIHPQVLLLFMCPSNGFWFDPRYPQCNYLARTTNKAKEQSTTNHEISQIKRQQSMGRSNNTKRILKEKGLSPHGGCPILGLERNRSGCSLSTSLSHSLASTS
jgi:hypothetical protein